MTPQRLVKRLLSEDDDDAHNELWTQLVDLVDRSNDPSLTGLVDFLAQTYNGGITQYIENGYAEEFPDVYNFVKTLPKGIGKELAAKLQPLLELIPAAEEEARESGERSRQGGAEEENPYENFENDFEIVEDWIYDRQKMDPILRAIVADGAEDRPRNSGATNAT
jgi:hypothetical protein